jgi:hypothetical protein
MSAQADVDIVNGPSVQGSFLCQLRFLQLGGEFMCNTHLEEKNSKPELVDLNVGGAFIAPDWFASVRTTNLFKNVRVGYTCVLSRTLNFGALVNYRVFQNQQSVLIGALWRYACSCLFSQNYRPDDHTQVRGRIDSAAIVGVSLHQRLTNYLNMTLCAEVCEEVWSLPLTHRRSTLVSSVWMATSLDSG